MAAGVPAIGSRGEDGPEEIAAAGGGMVLVPRGDVEALAAEIEALLSDPDRRAALGREAAGERHLDDESLRVAVGHVSRDRADGRLEKPLDGLPGAAAGGAHWPVLSDAVDAPSRSSAAIDADGSRTAPAAMFSAR